MVDFNFSATAECDRCGKHLASSDADCDNCEDYPLRRYHFIHIMDEDNIEIVYAINAIRAWARLHEVTDGDTLPWKLWETRSMSMHYSEMGYNVLEKDELRTPNL